MQSRTLERASHHHSNPALRRSDDDDDGWRSRGGRQPDLASVRPAGVHCRHTYTVGHPSYWRLAVHPSRPNTRINRCLTPPRNYLLWSAVHATSFPHSAALPVQCMLLSQNYHCTDEHDTWTSSCTSLGLEIGQTLVLFSSLLIQYFHFTPERCVTHDESVSFAVLRAWLVQDVAESGTFSITVGLLFLVLGSTTIHQTQKDPQLYTGCSQSDREKENLRCTEHRSVRLTGYDSRRVSE